MSKKCKGQSCKAKVGWDAAVLDAEEKVKQAERKLVELKAALAVCIERRDSGAPWPGEDETRESEAA